MRVRVYHVASYVSLFAPNHSASHAATEPLPSPGTQAEENKEWIAKYGYKRWGTSYVDKSQLDNEAGAKPAAAPAAKVRTNARMCGGVEMMWAPPVRFDCRPSPPYGLHRLTTVTTPPLAPLSLHTKPNQPAAAAKPAGISLPFGGGAKPAAAAPKKSGSAVKVTAAKVRGKFAVHS